MTLFWLHALGSPLTLLLFVGMARPRANPLQLLARAARTALRTRGGRRTLLVLASILAGNFLECAVDPWVSAHLGYDLTRWISALEGDRVARLQSFVPGWASLPLAWFYLCGFVAALATPLVVWTAEEDWVALRRYVRAFTANYLIVLPFYLFVPVNEAAWSGLSSAQPLLDNAFAGVSAALRSGSATDNCLPSLHVSLMVTLALCVQSTEGGRYARLLAWFAAAATAFAVVALGVHWVLDVVAGVLFAALCTTLGARIT